VLVRTGSVRHVPRRCALLGGIPYDEAEASMRLFAAEALPAVKQIPVAKL